MFAVAAHSPLARCYRYVIAVPFGLLGRLVWTMSIIPNFMSDVKGVAPGFATYFTPFLGALALVQRTVWAFFKMERQHLSNTEGYRDTTFIPLHFETAVKKRRRQDRDGNDPDQRTAKLRALVEGVAIASLVIVLALAAALPDVINSSAAARGTANGSHVRAANTSGLQRAGRSG